MIRFASWWFLFLIPLVIFMFFFTRKKQMLKFSSINLLGASGAKKTVKHKIGKVFVLCGIILSLVALARPQAVYKADIIRQGIDIALLLDVSGSMQSVDFEPNRMEVARKTIDDFIVEREDDRIALIVFAGTAYTRIPLTLDHNIVRESLSSVTSDSVSQDGTAIGMAVSVGLNRLKKSDAVSRVMILVTDGKNNAGAIDPVSSTKLAAELGIRIYTIGVGGDTLIIPTEIYGRIEYRQYPGGFDEELLKWIANSTDGEYFHAKDSETLSGIFEIIGELEKKDFVDESYTVHNDLAHYLLILALPLIMAGIILDRYLYVQIP